MWYEGRASRLKGGDTRMEIKQSVYNSKGVNKNRGVARSRGQHITILHPSGQRRAKGDNVKQRVWHGL